MHSIVSAIATRINPSVLPALRTMEDASHVVMVIAPPIFLHVIK